MYFPRKVLSIKNEFYFVVVMVLASCASTPDQSVLVTSVDEVERNCSENSIALIERSWNVYPLNTNPKVGDPNKGLSLLETALRDSPDCQWGLRLISALYIELDRYMEAKKYNERNLKLYPDDSAAIATQSWLYVYDEKFAEAISLIESTIINFGSGNGHWHYALAKIYAQGGDISKSLDMLEIAASISKKWLDENNAQTSDALSEVVRNERFLKLLED